VTIDSAQPTDKLIRDWSTRGTVDFEHMYRTQTSSRTDWIR